MGLRQRKKKIIHSKKVWICEVPLCCHFSSVTVKDLLEKFLPGGTLIVSRYNHCFIITNEDYSGNILFSSFRRPLVVLKNLGEAEIFYNDKEVRGRISPPPMIGHYSKNESDSIEAMKGYWESLNRVLKNYVDGKL